MSMKSTKVSIFAFAVAIACAILLSEVAFAAEETSVESVCQQGATAAGLCRSQPECAGLLLGEKDSAPYNPVIATLLKTVIPLRYNVKVNGLEEVRAKGEQGILFVSNHEAPIDPLILLSALQSLQVRPVMSEELVMMEVAKIKIGELIRKGAAGVNAILIPVHKPGRRSTAHLVKGLLGEIAQSLKEGDNILIYPSGNIQKSANEYIGQTRGVETILKTNPDVRIVMIRQRGIWGSTFSHGTPVEYKDTRTGLPAAPSTAKLMMDGFFTGIKTLLANGIFFAPKRQVRLEFLEALDFPRGATRDEMNRYMERFFNDPADPEVRTKVPYHFLLGREPVELEAVDYSRPSLFKASDQRLRGISVTAPSFDPGI